MMKKMSSNQDTSQLRQNYPIPLKAKGFPKGSMWLNWKQMLLLSNFSFQGIILMLKGELAPILHKPFPENGRERSQGKPLLGGCFHPDTKTRQRDSPEKHS